jgi:hypothetical protein
LKKQDWSSIITAETIIMIRNGLDLKDNKCSIEPENGVNFMDSI